MSSRANVNRAIARAQAILPGRPAPDGQPDPRWQAMIRVGEFVRDEPDAVWAFVRQWGKHAQADLRAAVATCLLEHLLEHHFDAIFPHARREALASVRFADTLGQCSRFGQSAEPANAARWSRLRREVGKRHRERSERG
jgi:hypothetical protein